MALLVLHRQFMFAVGLFKEMLTEHVFKIIESQHFKMSLYEICKTILGDQQQEQSTEMTMKEFKEGQNQRFQQFITCYTEQITQLELACKDTAVIVNHVIKQT